MSLDLHTARALLEWQIELGVDESMADTPIDRFALHAAQKATTAAGPVAPAAESSTVVDPIAHAQDAARKVTDLSGLQAALETYPHCELKLGARSLVFSDGNPAARVMIIGEAPGRDEDIQGKPFVGRAGQLLDRMFDAIGLSRRAEVAERALYISNILPWRPPQNRDPTAEEIAMMRPFMDAHVKLAAPDLIVLMGNISCQAILGRRGITRLRGHWTEALGRPVLPMFHPAYLLRNPAAKREAWQDLLAISAHLKSSPA
ncbi:MAG: uracil-DNA glycosylase [Pseudomonadota bacterium]